MSTVITTQNTNISASRGDYLQNGRLSNIEGKKRELINNEGETLGWKAMKNYLSGGGEIADGELFECVISLHKKDFEKLGESLDERKKNTHEAVRRTYEKLFAELGYTNVNFASSIHLNTDNPHIHTVVYKHCQDLETGSETILNKIPQQFILRERKGNSVLGNYFEDEINKVSQAVPMSFERTVIDEYNKTEIPNPEAPYAARYRKVLSYLENEKDISTELIEKLTAANILYVNTQGASVFNRRNPKTHDLTGYVNQNGFGQDSGEGFFFLGNPGKSAKYILTSTPLEALSVYELSKHRDLSDVCIISCDGKAPSPQITNFLKERTGETPMRVIWSLGLNRNNLPEKTALEDFQNQILNARNAESPRLEILGWNPDARFGGTWNAQLTYKKAKDIFRAKREEILNIDARLEEKLLAPAEESKEDERRAELARRIYSKMSVSTDGNSFVVVDKTNPESEIGRYDWTFKTENVFTLQHYRNQIQDGRVEYNDELDLLNYLNTRYEAEREIENASAKLNDSLRENPVDALERNAGEYRRKPETTSAQDFADKAVQNLINDKTASLELRTLPLEDVLKALNFAPEKYKDRLIWKSSADSQKDSFGILFDDEAKGGYGQDWYDTFNQKPGRGAIDLVAHLQNKEFRDAKIWLLQNLGSQTEVYQAEIEKFTATQTDAQSKHDEPLRLYARADENLEKVVNYLSLERGLSIDFVREEIINGNIYADRAARAMFVYRNPAGEITGAAWRATDSFKRMLLNGSDLDAGWYNLGNLQTAEKIVIVEDAIEALSYYELEHLKNGAEKTAVIGVFGTKIPDGLLEYISQEKSLVTLSIAFADKTAGNKSFRKAEIALGLKPAETDEEKEIKTLSFGGELIRETAVMEDWNAELVTLRESELNENNREQLEEERANIEAEDSASINKNFRLRKLSEIKIESVRANPHSFFIYAQSPENENDFLLGEPNVIAITLKTVEEGTEKTDLTADEIEENINAVDRAFERISELPENAEIIIAENGIGFNRLAENSPRTYEYLTHKFLSELDFDYSETEPSEIADGISKTDRILKNNRTVNESKAVAAQNIEPEDKSFATVDASAALDATLDAVLPSEKVPSMTENAAAQNNKSVARIAFRPRPVNLATLDQSSSKELRAAEYNSRLELNKFAAEILNDVNNPQIPASALEDRIIALRNYLNVSLGVETKSPLDYAEEHLVMRVSEETVEIVRPTAVGKTAPEAKAVDFNIVEYAFGLNHKNIFIVSPNTVLTRQTIAEIIDLENNSTSFNTGINPEGMPTGFIFTDRQKADDFFGRVHGKLLIEAASQANLKAQSIINELPADYREAVESVFEIAKRESFLGNLKKPQDFYFTEEYRYIYDHLRGLKTNYDERNADRELLQTTAADENRLDANRVKRAEVRQPENLPQNQDEPQRAGELSESARRSGGNRDAQSVKGERGLADGEGTRRNESALTAQSLQESLDTALEKDGFDGLLTVAPYSENISEIGSNLSFGFISQDGKLNYLLTNTNENIWQIEWINNYSEIPEYVLLGGNQPDVSMLIKLVAANEKAIADRAAEIREFAATPPAVDLNEIYDLETAKDELFKLLENDFGANYELEIIQDEEQKYFSVYSADGDTRYTVFEPDENGFWYLMTESYQPATSYEPPDWVIEEGTDYEYFGDIAGLIVESEAQKIAALDTVAKAEAEIDDIFPTFADREESDSIRAVQAEIEAAEFNETGITEAENTETEIIAESVAEQKFENIGEDYQIDFYRNEVRETYEVKSISGVIEKVEPKFALDGSGDKFYNVNVRAESGIIYRFVTGNRRELDARSAELFRQIDARKIYLNDFLTIEGFVNLPLERRASERIATSSEKIPGTTIYPLNITHRAAEAARTLAPNAAAKAEIVEPQTIAETAGNDSEALESVPAGASLPETENPAETAADVISGNLKSSPLAQSKEQFGRVEKRVAKLLYAVGLENEFQKEEGFYAVLKNDPYMPLHITSDGETLRLTYWYEQNGDLMHDGEINFNIGGGFLKFHQSGVGIYGVPKFSFDKSYAEMFSKNIIDQGYEEAEVINPHTGEPYFEQAEETHSIRFAVNTLLGVCDGAVTYDGHGFNGLDAGYARHLGEKQDWTRRDAENAFRMLKKYSKQLSSYGIRYKALEKDIENFASAEDILTKNRNIFIIGEKLNITFPYHAPLVAEVKQIPTAKFNSDERGKYWTVEISENTLPAVKTLAGKYEFNLSDEVTGYLETEDSEITETVAQTSGAEATSKNIKSDGELNEYERAVFHSAITEIVNQTGGQFGFLNNAETPSGMSREQFAGYSGSLVKKGFLQITEEKSRQIMLTERGASLLREENWFPSQYFEVIDGEDSVPVAEIKPAEVSKDVLAERTAGRIKAIIDEMTIAGQENAADYEFRSYAANANAEILGVSYLRNQIGFVFYTTDETTNGEVLSAQLFGKNSGSFYDPQPLARFIERYAEASINPLYAELNSYTEEKLAEYFAAENLGDIETEIVSGAQGKFFNNSVRLILRSAEGGEQEIGVVSENLERSEEEPVTYYLWQKDSASGKFVLRSDDYSFSELTETLAQTRREALINNSRNPEIKPPASGLSQTAPAEIIAEIHSEVVDAEIAETPTAEDLPVVNTQNAAASNAAPVQLSFDVETTVTPAVDVPGERGQNFRLADENIYNGSDKARFKKNLAAIELLKRLEDENRLPVNEIEREILASFSGFGSMKGAFELSENKGWEQERKQLSALLTEEEYASVFQSTKNAHYTSPRIAKSLWGIAQRLGFKGGRVIEPAVGSGVFLGTVPDAVLKDTEITAVELDSLTARITKNLYPRYEVKNTGYENHNVPKNWYDLAIGNVPFGDYRVYDPTYNGLKASIHDYFAIKGLDQVREGGLQIIITSAFTMDKIDEKFRTRLFREGKLVGAMRLPSGVFMEAAGTEVTTDVLVFQKYTTDERNQNIKIQEEYDLAKTRLELANSDVAKAEKSLDRAREENNLERAAKIRKELAGLKEIQSAADAAHLTARALYESRIPSWLSTVKTQAPDKDGNTFEIKINRYYAENPQMVLGELRSDNSLYSGEPEMVVRLTEDFDERLSRAVEFLPVGIMPPRHVEKDENLLENQIQDTTVKVGSVKIENNRLLRAVKNEFGYMSYVEDTKVKPAQIKRIERMLDLRDTAVALRNADFLAQEKEAGELRRSLNLEYDRFLRDFGALNLPKNYGLMKTDPDVYLLRSLENFDEATKKVEKTDFFRQPTVEGYKRPERAANLTDAVAISLNETGSLGMRRMISLLKEDHETEAEVFDRIVQEFKETGMAFLDPHTEQFLPRNEYLSGNVKEKLQLAQTAAALEAEKYGLNVRELEKIIPADIPFDEIDVQIGAPYLEPEDISGFLVHLTGGKAEDFIVNFAPRNGMWTASYAEKTRQIYETKAQTNEIWGTHRMNMIEIVQHALDGQRIRITDKDTSGGKTVYVLNAEATEAANAKLADITDEFETWIWADESRRTRIAAKYNALYNYHVPMKYDGSYLTFPGLAKEIDGVPFTPYPFQKDVIDRMIKSGSLLVAHEVGLGKTWEMILAAMKMKQMGKSKSPVIAVKKSTIEEITKKAQAAYPNARILSFDGNFEKDKRNLLMNRLSTNDYDIVVMTHDQLDRLPMKPEVMARHVNEELAELQDVITEVDESVDTRTNAGRRMMSKLLSARSNLITNLREALETNKDDSIFFEETGIDTLFVDEFQRYKALPIYTKHAEIKGIPNTRSKRAVNMLVRGNWLAERNNGQGLFGFTGTPITNSPAELYVLQKYFQAEGMELRRISHFDAWLKIYARTVTKLEKTATGEYKQVSRLAKYANLPELVGMTGEFMDIKRAKGLVEIVRPEAEQIVVDLPMSDSQRAFIRHLQIRAANLDDPRVDNMLAISTDARKCSLDMRLVGGDNESLSGDGDIIKVPTKVDEVVARLVDLRQTNPTATQVVFSDIGIHDVVFPQIIQGLLDKGIPQDKIINFSALSENQRKHAVRRLNNGEAWFGLGSTETLGTGTNVQKHLLAMHHLDVPWLPSSVEQRDGRGIRAGNTWADLNEKIKVYRYVTVGAFDELMWQTVDRKQKFINSIMFAEGDPAKIKSRTYDDKDSEEFSYEEIAAIASGNPLMLRRVELDQRVSELTRAESRFKQSRRRMSAEYESLKEQTTHTRQLIEDLKTDRELYRAENAKLGSNLDDAKAETQILKDSFKEWKAESKAKRESGEMAEDVYMAELAERFAQIQDAEALETPFEVTLAGKKYTNRAEAGKFLSMLMATNTEAIKKFGEYKGFDLIVKKPQSQLFSQTVYLQSPRNITYELSFSTDEGAWRSADSKLSAIDERISGIEKNGGLLLESIKKLETEKEKKFKYTDELTESSRELDILDYHLSVYELPDEEKAFAVREYVADKYGDKYIPEEFKTESEADLQSNQNDLDLNPATIEEPATNNNLKDKISEFLENLNETADFELDGTVLTDLADTQNAGENAFYREALELRGKPLADYWFMMQAEAQDAGEIKVNPAAYELLHRIYREDFGMTQLEKKEFGGTFNEPSASVRLIESLEKTAKSNPEFSSAVNEIAETVRTATADGTKWLKVIADEKSIEHENMHVGSFLARRGQEIEEGHSRFAELVAHPALKKADALLTAEIGNVPQSIKVEELAATCGIVDKDGRRAAAAYNLTKEDEKSFLKLYFTSIAEKNGIETKEHFKEIANESAQIRDEVYTRLATEQQQSADPTRNAAESTNQSAEYGGNTRRDVSGIPREPARRGNGQREAVSNSTGINPETAFESEMLKARIEKMMREKGKGVFFAFTEPAATIENIELEIAGKERELTEILFNSPTKMHTVETSDGSRHTVNLKKIERQSENLNFITNSEKRESERARLTEMQTLIEAEQAVRREELVKELSRLADRQNSLEKPESSTEIALRDFDKQYHESVYARQRGKVIISEQKLFEVNWQAERAERTIDFHKVDVKGEEKQLSLKDIANRVRMESADALRKAKETGELDQFAAGNNLSAKAAEFQFRKKTQAAIENDYSDTRAAIVEANHLYLKELQEKQIAAVGELVEARQELAGKSLKISQPDAVAPVIESETLWRYQSKALRRGDAASFEKLEQVREQTMSPRSNYAVAQLKGAAFMAELDIRLKEERIKKLRDEEASRDEFVELTYTNINGKPELKSFSFNSAQEKTGKMRELAENKRDYRNNQIGQAAHSAWMPVNNLINPFSSVQGTLSWFTNPGDTLMNHANPVNALKNDSGIQMVRASMEISGSLYQAWQAHRDAKKFDHEAEYLENTAPRSIGDKITQRIETEEIELQNLKQISAVAEKSLVKESDLRSKLAEIYQRTDLEMPCKELSAYEIEKVGKAAVTLQDGELLTTYQKSLTNPKIREAVGETIEDTATRSLKAQVEAAISAKIGFEDAELTETGEIVVRMPVEKLRQAQAAVEFADTADDLRMSFGGGIEPDFTDAGINDLINKSISEMDAATGAELSRIYESAEMLPNNPVTEAFEKINEAGRNAQIEFSKPETLFAQNSAQSFEPKNYIELQPQAELSAYRMNNPASGTLEKPVSGLDKLQNESALNLQKGADIIEDERQIMTEEMLKIAEQAEMAAEAEALEAAEMGMML